MLEPYAGKLARTVLRGEESGNGFFLPDTHPRSPPRVLNRLCLSREKRRVRDLSPRRQERRHCRRLSASRGKGVITVQIPGGLSSPVGGIEVALDCPLTFRRAVTHSPYGYARA